MKNSTRSKFFHFSWRAMYVCHWVWFICLITQIIGHPLVLVPSLQPVVVLVFAMTGCVIQTVLFLNERVRRDLAENKNIARYMFETSAKRLEEFRAEIDDARDDGRQALLASANEQEEALRDAHMHAALKLAFRSVRRSFERNHETETEN